MKVKELIKFLSNENPNAEVMLLRDLNPELEYPFYDEDGNETEIETEMIEIDKENIVLAKTYVGFQIP